jgi:hypothetical protein
VLSDLNTLHLNFATMAIRESSLSFAFVVFVFAALRDSS